MNEARLASDSPALSAYRHALVDVRRALTLALIISGLNGLRCVENPYFFWHDDFQTQHLPASFEIANAWLSGEVPLLSKHSWFAGSFGGEYQYGVFSVFLTACNLLVWQLGLSLPATAACLAIIHLGIVAAGAYLLARSYAVGPALSALVAFVASSNGWLIAWGATTWFPALTSFAWIPWLWLGLRGVVHRVSGSRIALCGVALYLVLSAGWPFTSLMAALLIVWLGAPLVLGKRLRAAGGVALSVMIGAALSAPAVLLLAEYVSTTARSSSTFVLQRTWIVPPEALLGLVLPTYTSTWTAFTERKHAALELAGGFVPLVGLLAAATTMRRTFLRQYRRELILLGILLVLMVLPSAGVFRWSFRWLPLFHLALGLTGATAIQACHHERSRRSLAVAREIAPVAATRFVAGRLRRLFNVPQRFRPSSAWPNLGGLALVVMIVVLWVAASRDDRFSLRSPFVVAHLAMIAAWICVEAKGTRRAIATFPAVFAAFTVVSVFSFMNTDQEIPSWRISENIRTAPPYRHDVRYLALYRWDDLMSNERVQTAPEEHPLFRPGNMPMFAGLSFINGYSPMQPRGLRELLGLRDHGYVELEHAIRILEKETRPGALLEHLGVDGLVLHQNLADMVGSARVPPMDWERVAGSDGQILLQRRHASRPLATLVTGLQTFETEETAFSSVKTRASESLPLFVVDPRMPPQNRGYCRTSTIDSVSEQRLSAAVTLRTRSCSDDSVVLFRRPWFPGYRARMGVRELPVLVIDSMMPGVLVPPGVEGEVTLEYRPRSLSLGIAAAVVGLLALVALCASRVRWVRPPSGGTEAGTTARRPRAPQEA